MTKLPSIQFYPADWLNDIALQSCSLTAKGLLIDMMCIMHQSKKYGYLLINGVKPSHKQLTKLLRTDYKAFTKGLRELLFYGRIEIDEDGIYFCRRLIKDQQLREIRREAGKLGGNPNLLNPKVNHASKQKTTPSSSSSTSTSKKTKEKRKKKEKKLYLDFIYLAEEEYKKLIKRFGEQTTKKMIDSANSYAHQMGEVKFKAKYNSHYYTILNWARMNNVPEIKPPEEKSEKKHGERRVP